MLHRPEDVPLFQAAHLIVGCSTESANKVYFTAEKAIDNLGDHDYMAFFDVNGDKIGEVQVQHWMDQEYRVATNY